MSVWGSGQECPRASAVALLFLDLTADSRLYQGPFGDAEFFGGVDFVEELVCGQFSPEQVLISANGG